MGLLKPASNRLPELDFLRGIAILLVLGRHMMWLPNTLPGFIGHFLILWKRAGWIGVEMFFVLSGFLVGGLLLREGRQFGTILPGLFLLRRGMRIYPAFYVFIFLSLAIAHEIRLPFQTWPTALYSELAFLQNYVPGLWPQTWSLAIEEHFYFLLLGLLLWIIKHTNAEDPFRSLPRVVLILNTVILAGRVIAGYGFHFDWSVLYFQTQWRIDSLLFGVLLFYGIDRHHEMMTKIRNALSPWRFVGWPLLIGPTLFLNIEDSSYLPTVELTMLYLAFGWIVLHLILKTDRTEPKRRRLSVVASIGRHSYSIYLWHFTLYYAIFTYVHRTLHWHPSFALESFAFVSAAVLLGIGMSLLIEQPSLYWRDRWFPARVKAIPS